MLKVMTIVGTRPEIIRLSRVIARLDDTVDHVLVHTGQNYDPRLNDIFFAELGIRRPDHLLGVDTSSLGRVLGETLIRSEEVLTAVRPDAVVVLGDTNSCIAAVMAKRLRIPVYHMEAGNRCFDGRVPEETNRRMVDHVADFNLVYTEHARRNLLDEGIHPQSIILTGSPMREVLEHYRDRIESSDAVARLGLTPGEFMLVSAHREENVDSPESLRTLLATLREVRRRYGVPVVVSTHPRTRNRLRQIGATDAFDGADGIAFHEPFGFLDYCSLQRQAKCVLSDSGTVSEESAILGFPAVTLRAFIERPEAIDAGTIVTTGLDTGPVTAGIDLVLAAAAKSERDARTIPAEYQVADTSHRVVSAILSTAWSVVPGPRRMLPGAVVTGGPRS